MASLIPNVLEDCDGFFGGGGLIPPCWNQPCAVSNWWFIKRSAGVAHSHDNKNEIFTFVFPRNVWARLLLPLNHLISNTVPAAVIPHQLFVTAVFRMSTSVLEGINIIAASVVICMHTPRSHHTLIVITRRHFICKNPKPAVGERHVKSLSPFAIMEVNVLTTGGGADAIKKYSITTKRPAFKCNPPKLEIVNCE